MVIQNLLILTSHLLLLNKCKNVARKIVLTLLVSFIIQIVLTMDARKLTFDTGSFDVVLDKATLDSFMVKQPQTIVRRFLN